MKEHKYEYYAFISYSRKDEKWAKWLQKSLEKYKLSGSIRKESDETNPKQIRPVFLDQTDIGASKSVSDNLKEELADSRYLIVICSPESAKSTWVDKEVKHFQELGRTNRIIPFIVDGTPDPKTPSQEQCYPPSLLTGSDPILGVSIKELKNRQMALVKIVAALLGVKFDKLWQRHKRQKMQQIIIATAAAILLAVTSGFFVNHYLITHIDYYGEFVERWGVPEGLVPLTSNEVAHNEYSWRFETRAGKIRRLTLVNSAGSMNLPNYIPVDRTFHYRENGKLGYVKEYNPAGGITQKREYSENLEYMVFKHQNGFSNKSIDAQTALVPRSDEANNKSKGNIVAYRYKYDEQGRVVTLIYLNSSEAPVSDAEGVFGQAFTYSQHGRKTITFLNSHGYPHSVKGVSGKRYSFTPRGRIARVEWVNSEGQIVYTTSGYAVVSYTRDKWGNIIHTTYLSPDNQPCVTSDRIASHSKAYDEHGNRIEIRYFGIDGKPATHKNWYSTRIEKHDQQGNVTLIKYLNQEGLACLRKGNHFSSQQYDHDEHGNISKISYFGILGSPIISAEGFHSIELEYNKDGKRLQESMLGIDGKPRLGKGGWSTVAFEYDRRGNEIKRSFLNTEGKPVEVHAGFSVRTAEYDQRGNEVKSNYLDIKGQPTINRWGYSARTTQYDQKGNLIRRVFLGVDGKPRYSHTQGCAGYSIKYDQQGNEIQRDFIGADGTPCINKNYGFSRLVSEFDSRGNTLKTSYYDTKGKPCLHNQRYSSWEREYDSKGREVRTSFYGVNGEFLYSE